MADFKTLIREPALIVEGLSQLLFLFVAFAPGLVSGDQQVLLIGAIVALGGLVKAFVTKPFAVTALTDFIRAGLLVAVGFNVAISADLIAALTATVGLFVTAVVRGQITPRYDPVTDVRGSGSGPVRGDAGAANILYVLGVVLVLLAVLLLVTTLLKVFVVSWLALIVLFIVGVALLVWQGNGTTRV